MKQLNMKITGVENLERANLLVDGKPVKCKRNEFGNLRVKKDTDQDRVKVKLVSYLDYGGVVWFILQLFFFLISIFGIFDRHDRPSTAAVDFEAEVVPGDEVVIRCTRKPGQEMTIVTEGNIHVIKNECHVNENARRTFKILRYAKIGVAIATIVLLVTLFIK